MPKDDLDPMAERLQVLEIELLENELQLLDAKIIRCRLIIAAAYASFDVAREEGAKLELQRLEARRAFAHFKRAKLLAAGFGR